MNAKITKRIKKPPRADSGAPTEKHKWDVPFQMAAGITAVTTHGAGTDAAPQIGNSTLGMSSGTALTAQHWDRLLQHLQLHLEQVTPEQPPWVPQGHPSALEASDPGNFGAHT